MCGSSTIDNTYRPYAPPADEVVRRTREVEAAMEGERVPEPVWTLFFSPSCEPIPPTYFRRMFMARRAAVTYLAVQSSSRLRPRAAAAFRCLAD
jgi:hypothetical protein